MSSNEGDIYKNVADELTVDRDDAKRLLLGVMYRDPSAAKKLLEAAVNARMKFLRAAARRWMYVAGFFAVLQILLGALALWHKTSWWWMVAACIATTLCSNRSINYSRKLRDLSRY